MQPQWEVIQGNSQVVMVEPVPESIEALKKMYAGFPGKFLFLPYALSDKLGDQTLYIFNQTTGSSLLPPGGEFCEEYVEKNYIYPLREVTIKTHPLEQVLNENKIPTASLLKIDVQGADLKVLQGMGSRVEELAGIEVEVGAPGAYLGQPNLQEVEKWLSERGFEVFDIRPSRVCRGIAGDGTAYHRQFFNVTDEAPSISWRLAELDVLFFKKQSVVLAKRDPLAIRRQIAAYCVYRFYTEALHLGKRAVEEKILSAADFETIRQAILGWHDSQSFLWFYRRTPFWAFVRKWVYKFTPKSAPRWSQYILYNYPNG